MIPSNIVNEYEQLKNEVLKHNYRYFVLSDPVISDEEYDKLFKRLVEIETLYPQIKSPDSPSFRVGSAAVSGFAKVPHSMPMLSLDNTYNDDDIKAFNDRVLKGLDGQAPEYLCELKIDGVSISLSYKKGVLVQALTRGDGITGEDVTMNIKTLHSIPLKLNTDVDLQIRGEVYMPNKEFERI
ncbi:MAG TPA: NAD-dependent DNA ligase LigA, partial [Petrotogaceae bacterium]|nr:NAD-dependent DNA ligase LigA [Petrotogaceae bacterium]